MTVERDRHQSQARVPVTYQRSMTVKSNQLGQFECRRSRHRSREGCARISHEKETQASNSKQQSRPLEASVICGTRTIQISARMSPVNSPLSLAGVLVALAALATFSAQYSHCDTPTGGRTVGERSSASLLSRSQRTVDKQMGASLANGRERFLSSLADSIERQHFNAINPVRSLVGHQRPSKYDSGNEFEPIQTSNWLAKSSQRLSEAPKGKPGAKGSQSKKADESMQSIMRMHEHANMMAAHHNGANSKTSPQTGEQAPNKPLDWRELSRAPARVASSLMSHSKVVGKVFSRIAPLMGTKSADSTVTAPATSASYPSILLQPFIARNNGAKTQSATNLLQHLSRRPPATVAPQTASLESPSNHQHHRQQSTKSGRQMASTQPTTALGSQAAVLSSALTRPDPADDLLADSSSTSVVSDTSSSQVDANLSAKKASDKPQDNLAIITSSTRASTWLKNSANQFAQNYFQDSLRGLLTLSQLPILPGGQLSTAPSVLEKGGRFGKDSNKTSSATDDSQRKKIINELVRYAYIISTSARRKKDPLKALLPPRGSLLLANRKGIFGQRSVGGPVSTDKDQSLIGQASHKFKTYLSPVSMNKAKPRGVMWDVATDPSLVVTLFHLLERASVALPLGFLLMPFVQMTRNPFSGLGGLNLASILPPRASHRSIDYEELAKRLDVVDKMLSRALRPTHREQSFMGR